MMVLQPLRRHFAGLALALISSTTLAGASDVGSSSLDSSAAAFAEMAVEGLREFGQGIFEIVAVAPGDEQDKTFVDGQKYTRHIHMVELKGVVRYTADLIVPTREELRAAVGGPGWTLEQSLRDLDRLLTLGAGLHSAGSTQEIYVRAALGRRQAGWYFRTIETIGPKEVADAQGR